MTNRPYSMEGAVSILYRHEQVFLNRRLKGYKLGRGQFSVLNALLHHDGENQDTLSQTLRIDKGTTARSVQKLEENGYVRREVMAKDRRSNRIFVTDQARAIHQEIHEILREWNSLLTANLTDEERAQLDGLLMRVVGNACEAIDGLAEEDRAGE